MLGEDAADMARVMDGGGKQYGDCTKILTGRRYPVPVVQVDLYRIDSAVEGAIPHADVPLRQPARGARISRLGCLLGIGFGLILLISAVISSLNR
jgi:hypothetical protein